MSNFPKVLFVKRETEANGPDWFSATEYKDATVEVGEIAGVGVYTLSEVKCLKGVVEEVKRGKRKKK
jgi:hypothetical protein